MGVRESLAGRVAVVTGASRGMGKVFVEALLAEGVKVAAFARPSSALDDFAKSHPDVLAVPCDVGDPKQVTAAFDQVVAKLGPPTIVINNAGLCIVHSIEETTDEEGLLEVGTNLLGPLWCARSAIPHMRKAGLGDIINISSESVRQTLPYLALYAATKAGLESLSEGLRQEVRKDGVRVTVLRSGSVSGGEIHRMWTDDRGARFTEAMQKGGHADYIGKGIRPQTTARAMIDMLTMPRESNIAIAEVRAI